jgi:hypothetical protein
MPWPKLVHAQYGREDGEEAAAAGEDAENAGNGASGAGSGAGVGAVGAVGAAVVRLEWVQMLILEEDVEAFTARCRYIPTIKPIPIPYLYINTY